MYFQSKLNDIYLYQISPYVCVYVLMCVKLAYQFSAYQK